jgi:hypothetical protein
VIFQTNKFTSLEVIQESEMQMKNKQIFMVQILEKDGNQQGIAYFCIK